MNNLIIKRQGNKVTVTSLFSNQTFRAEFSKEGYLKAKTPLDLKMVTKALKLQQQQGNN